MIAADGYVVVNYDPNDGGIHLDQEIIDSTKPNISNSAVKDGATFTYWEVVYHQIFPESNNAQLTLLAHFEAEEQLYELSLVSLGGGYATGQGQYYYDENVTIQAIPETGYSFYCWAYRDTDDILYVLSFDNPYTFSMPNYAYELYACFEGDNNSTMNDWTGVRIKTWTRIEGTRHAQINANIKSIKSFRPIWW